MSHTSTLTAGKCRSFGNGLGRWDSNATAVAPARARRVGWLMLIAAMALAATSARAGAGAVLLTRDSLIQGGGQTPEFDGTATFERFAQDVHPADDSATPWFEAHQYSAPGIGADGFEGAFAEGSVKAGPAAAGGRPSAESTFNLKFQVVGAPATYQFGAALGTDGSGVSSIALMPMPPLTAGGAASARPLVDFKAALPGQNSKVFDQHGVLQPGIYELRVHADMSAGTNAGSAYFNVNLMLSPASTSHAVALPPAAWTSLVTLTGLAAIAGVKRCRARQAL